MGRKTELRAGYARNLVAVPERDNRSIYYCVRTVSKAQPLTYLLGTGSSLPGHKAAGV